jgi:hypothetical protein
VDLNLLGGGDARVNERLVTAVDMPECLFFFFPLFFPLLCCVKGRQQAQSLFSSHPAWGAPRLFLLFAVFSPHSPARLRVLPVFLRQIWNAYTTRGQAAFHYAVQGAAVLRWAVKTLGSHFYLKKRRGGFKQKGLF